MNLEQLEEWKNAIFKEDRNITNFENFNFDVLYSIFEDCIADGIETRESVLDIINFIKEERYKIIDLDNILKKSKQYWLYAEFEFPTMQKALESKQL